MITLILQSAFHLSFLGNRSLKTTFVMPLPNKTFRKKTVFLLCLYRNKTVGGLACNQMTSSCYSANSYHQALLLLIGDISWLGWRVNSWQNSF